ncbi:putative pentatricopeptide repeat-containing protein At1g03510 [Coffea eugenioides]|uniref:putative pentatricopeptide repeat-containing protein At1g03510 n=1 Tax=Coffea eugenioides TaxID=49369 RepID=UPI000F610AE2|nr:putative pentatricopeptide repeat-containing protein At1g03510 [Coffea eugenioides]XP_027185757.1 putative pentatricopeptide repeat-containing protein At1g03510 [Coffea eugenioides]
MGSYSSNHLRLLSYTKLLASHVNGGRHQKALGLFHHIHSSLSFALDPFIFPLALKSCASLHCSDLGTSIHALTYKWSFVSNPFVASALVDMYGKCISISSARRLFDEIPQRNAVVWNAMISLYAHSSDMSAAMDLFEVMDVLPSVSSFNSIIAGFLEMDDGFYKAIGFYRRMLKLGLAPNLITVLALLRACLGVSSLNLIKEIHGYAVRNEFEPSMHLRSGLIEAYGRCGCLRNADSVFQQMKERDVVAWSSLISAYALQGEARTALEIFAQMEIANVKPDEITFLAVLKACSHAGLADEARVYFARIQNCYGVEANSDHYACLVDVLSRAGRLREAYEVIKGMPVKVTVKAWGALLAASRTYGEVELGEIAGRALLEMEPENPANYVILARLYSNAGRPTKAEEIRREMKERGLKATPGSSWTIHQN